MPRVEKSIVIQHPATAVFAYITDIELLPKRTPSIIKVEMTTGEDFVVGSQYVITRKTRGKEIEIINEVTQLEENRLLGVRTISGTEPYEETYELEEVKGGTKVTLSAAGDMSDSMSIFSSTFTRLLKRQIKNDLNRLKDLLEEENSH